MMVNGAIKQNGSYWYEIYDLCIRSNTALPELVPLPGGHHPSRVADVVVEFSSADQSMTVVADRLKHGDPAMYAQVSVGRYWIAGGREIIAEPVAGVNSEVTRFYLYARALPILLYQRGIIPIHASAARICGAGGLFVAESGGGKSTLAAALLAQGGAVFSDDISVVRSSSEAGVQVVRGTCQLHLSDQAARATDHVPPQVRFGAKGKNYYRAAPSADNACALSGIYFLEWSDAAGIEGEILPVRPFEALSLLRANAYLHSLLPEMLREAAFLKEAASILRTVPMFRFRRVRDLAALVIQARTIRQHLSSL